MSRQAREVVRTLLDGGSISKRIALRRACTLGLAAAYLVLLHPSPLSALDPHKAVTQYGLDTWTRADGLPQGTINAIVQTHDGYLWFGTMEGLVRFDGVRFTVFDSTNTPAMVEPDVRTLYEDRAGTLWIGTNAHLMSYRDGQWKARGLPEGYADRPNLCLYQAANGTFWVGSHGKLGTLQGDVIRDFMDLKGNTIQGATCMTEARDGSMWFGSDNLYRLKDGVLLPGCQPPAVAPVSSVTADQSGTIWFGTEGRGVGRLQNGASSLLPNSDGSSSDMVTSLLADKHGNMWVGTIGRGLRRYGDGGLATLATKDGLSSDQVMCLYEDREGSLWIGTNGGGLNRLRDGRCTTYSTQEGLRGKFVQAVCEGTDGSLWIGTNEGGISRLKDGRVVSHLTTQDGLSNDSVTNLMCDRHGDLWIGTGGGGLNRLSGAKLDAHPRGAEVLGPVIFSLYEDHAGTVWIGTEKGLWRYQDQRFTQVPGIENFPMCIQEDRQGRLWVGTMGAGLKCLADGQLRSFAAKEGLSRNIVISLHEDEGGELWIGTIGGGLDRLRDNKFAHITTKQGLPSDTIFKIHQDARGNLWMSCNSGIFSASKRELDRVADGTVDSVHCVAFDESDGMRNRECNGGGQTMACKARDGAFWFSTVDGVVRIDPQQHEQSRLPPPVFVEQMTVNGRVVTGAGAELPGVLPPGSDRLQFQYTGLSFLKPRSVQFRYKLEGLDSEWIDAGTRRDAFYTNVPPGRYTFRVIAAASEGAWNETGASVDFRIRPHFYQTVWFYALVAMTMIGAVHVLYRYRARRLLELERVRTRIATDLHDEIGAGLTHIAIISELVTRQLDQNPAESAGLVSTVAETARELVDSLTDVVWAIDPKLDDLPSLVVRIRKFSSEILEAKRIKLEMRVPDDVPRVRVGSDHRRQILLIFKEAINNIVRYAACSSVLLALDCSGGSIVGEIRDDGQGFDLDHAVPRGSGRGLASMRERAVRLGGSLTVTSEPGHGTRVTFSIPLKQHEHALPRTKEKH